MTIRAERDPSFYRRFWLMAIGAFFGALWFSYDGAVAWPNEQERAIKFEELKESGDADWTTQWREYAKERDWSTRQPKMRSDSEIEAQFYWAGLAAVIGLLLLGKVLLSLGMWIEADENGINTSWGKQVPFAAIERVNKKDWPKKGLARIYYADNGRTRKFVLDNFKFQREPTDAIMARVEEHLQPEQIVDGPTEAALAQERASAKETADA